jgi:L-iditol 2-dehydrogenase
MKHELIQLQKGIKIMKAIRLHASNDLRLHEEALPQPKSGQGLVRVKAVGICGSDLHWFAEGGIGDAKVETPLILGHEFAGTTESGQPVAVDPAIPCGKCEYCQRGHPNLCLRVVFAGHAAQDGAMCEWMAWDTRNLIPLPDSMNFADGAMLEPLGVAIHTVDLAHLKTGMTVGVFGCGPIGLLIIQMARLAGAVNILATDKLPHRLEAAGSLGATKTIMAEDGAEIKAVMAATGGRGVDVAFEAAGDQKAVDTSVAAVAPGGKVILAGIPPEDRTSFSASAARGKGLTIKLVHRMKHTYPRAIELVSKGLVDVRSLVTHRFPLEKTAEAFQAAQSRVGLKVIIEM